MAKSSIEINDEFVFRFPRNKVTSEPDIYPIPLSVLNLFVEKYNRIQLRGIDVNNKLSQTFQRYIPDLSVEPYYLFELEFTFSGIEKGGILYRPEFTQQSFLSIDLVDSSFDVDDEFYYLKLKIESELYWDFKSIQFKKIQSHIQSKGSTWQNAKMDIRMNIRNSSLYLDSYLFDDKGSAVSFDSFDKNSIQSLLNETPNIFSIIKNYLPENKNDMEIKFWQIIEDKNFKIIGDKF